MRYCKVCNDPIYFNNARVLCAKDSCRKANKNTWQRINKQRLALKAIEEGKVCKRCHVLVHEPRMKKYCASCSKTMQTKHYSSYVAKENIMIDKFRPCGECGADMKNPAPNRKWCTTCGDEKRVAQQAQQTIVRNAKRKIIRDIKRAKGDKTKVQRLSDKTDVHKGQLDEKWLVRGNITSTQVCTMMGA